MLEIPSQDFSSPPAVAPNCSVLNRINLRVSQMKTSLISKPAYFNATGFTVAVLILLSSLVAPAADISWTDGTASYNTPANWTGGVVPGPLDNAIHDNG